MKAPRVLVTRADIDFALAPNPWDFGNRVLYDLCAQHPKHNSDEAIIAKLWLIGRSYAAAIERRKNKKETSDDFYEKVVAPRVRASNIDDLLASLPAKPADPIATLPVTIEIHKQVMDIFQTLAGLGKRSLASKYLHFHRPDLFFIYDSRAQTSISALAPEAGHVQDILIPAIRDETYWKFCRRLSWLHGEIIRAFNETLDPRGMDKILLNVHSRVLNTLRR